MAEVILTPVIRNANWESVSRCSRNNTQRQRTYVVDVAQHKATEEETKQVQTIMMDIRGLKRKLVFVSQVKLTKVR